MEVANRKPWAALISSTTLIFNRHTRAFYSLYQCQTHPKHPELPMHDDSELALITDEIANIATPFHLNLK